MHLSSCLLKVVKPASTHLETPQWPCQDLRPAFWSHESHWRLPTDTNTKPYNVERLLSLSASLVWNNNPINGLSMLRGFETSSPSVVSLPTRVCLWSSHGCLTTRSVVISSDKMDRQLPTLDWGGFLNRPINQLAYQFSLTKANPPKRESHQLSVSQHVMGG